MACSLATAGCTVTAARGTWQVVAVSPPGEAFPLTTVSFDDRGRFTATSTSNGRDTSRTGMYEWRGRTLTLKTSRGAIEVYEVRKRSREALVLRRRIGSREVTANLSKAD